MPQSPVQPLDVWLKKLAEDQFKINQYAEIARTQNAVTLIRRFRGNSKSDSLGCFSTNQGSTAWLGDAQGSMDFANMHPLNIVKPAVIIYMSAMITARVALKIDSANKNPTLGGAANIMKGLYEFMDNREGYWDECLEAQIGQMSQLHYGWFLKSDHNPNRDSEDIMQDEWGMEDMPTAGKYVCQCGAGGPYFPKENEQEFTCPKCGKPAEVVEKSGMAPMEVPKGQKKARIGSNQTTVVSPFEIRLDERKTMGGRLKDAQWFEWHPLLTEAEMDEQFSGFDYGKTPAEWSFPMRWKYRLETGVDIFTRKDLNDMVRLWEVRNRWLRPEMYANRVEPSTYQMRDGNGRVIFEIGKDEKLIDKFPDGFLYKISNGSQGNHGVLLPFIEPSDFTKEWVYGGFTPDAFSFWMQPIIELIQLNDDATEMYTIDIQHRERNSQVSVVFNDQAFDEDSFENDLIPTKRGFDLNGLAPDHYFSTFEMPAMQEAMQGLKMIMELAPTIGAPQPAAAGAPSPGEPYAAQLLQKQSSLGKLSPSQQSKARAKKEWFVQQACIAQDTWPPEKFEYLRTRLGEEWKEEDIEAFLNCDIRRDIEVDYVLGTEVPTSQVERELKLNNLISQVGPLLSVNPNLLPPEVVSEWLQSQGIDHDFNNTEAEDRLCTSRLETIKEGMRTLGSKYEPPQLIAIILQHPQLQVLPKEDHKTAVEFFTDQQVAAMTEANPDQVYITILQSMIERHEQAATGTAQQQTQMQLEAQKPVLEAQAAMNQPPDNSAQIQAEQEARQQELAQSHAESQQKAQLEAAKIQAESERTQTDAIEAQNDRQHELEKAHLERTHQVDMDERQKAHELELEKLRAKNKPKEKAAA